VTPELEVLDQLLGGDMPLDVLARLFPDTGRFAHAFSKMIQAGEVRLADATGKPIPLWRFQELDRSGDLVAAAVTIRVSVTEVGAKRVA
jgi:hypothetical protein